MTGKAFGKTKTVGKPITGNDEDNLLDASSQTESTRINGGDGADDIIGTNAADRVNAGDGDDVVQGGLGNDVLFGNDGTDTAVFSGSILDYTWMWANGNTLEVSGQDGDDQLKHFERLQFDDFTYFIDGNNAPVAVLRSATETEENTAFDFDVDVYDFDGEVVSLVSVSSARGTVTATEDLAQSDASTMGSSEGLKISFDPGTDFDYLAVGEDTLETITLIIADSDGNETTVTYDITVTGTNDSPVITSAPSSGAVTEIADEAPGENVLTLNETGSIAFEDVDLTDVHTVSVVASSATDSTTSGATAVRGTLTPVIVDASTSDGTGQIDWTFEVADADLDDLAEGQTLTQVFTVEVDDGNGGTASQDIEITLAGTNDAPTLSGTSLEAEEDGPPVSVDLALLGDDVDGDDDGTTLSYAVTGQPAEGFASISGTTLTFAPGAGFQDLAVGETRDVTVQVTATDTHGATAVNDVVVTVAGTNDAPTTSIGFPDEHRLFEYTDDNPLEGTIRTGSDEFYDEATDTWIPGVYGGGGFWVYDVDVSDEVTFSVEALGTDYFTDYEVYDFEQITPTAWFLSWRYEIDDSALDVLSEGEVRTETFRVHLDDGNGGVTFRDSTIELVGTNDAPTLSGTSLEAEEDGPPVSVDLALLGDDVDGDDDGTTLSYAVTGQPAEGFASISGTTLTFAPGAGFQDLAVGETRDVTIQVTATDTHGATAVNDVVVTVAGTNDAPVAVPLTSLGVSEDSLINFSVFDFVSDAENDPLSLLSFSSLPGLTHLGGGNFSYDPTTIWQNLSAGDKQSNQFNFTVVDDGGLSATGNVLLNVIGESDTLFFTFESPDISGVAAVPDSNNLDFQFDGIYETSAYGSGSQFGAQTGTQAIFEYDFGLFRERSGVEVDFESFFVTGFNVSSQSWRVDGFRDGALVASQNFNALFGNTQKITLGSAFDDIDQANLVSVSGLGFSGGIAIDDILIFG